MKDYLFTFQSITQAQSGQRVLQYAGIPAHIQRTPKALAARGCGYSIHVSEARVRRAADTLRDAGIRYGSAWRMTESGASEEVFL